MTFLHLLPPPPPPTHPPKKRRKSLNISIILSISQNLKFFERGFEFEEHYLYEPSPDFNIGDKIFLELNFLILPSIRIVKSVDFGIF